MILHNVIPETRESDNEAQATLSVTPPPAPNLVVQAETVGLHPATPSVGEEVTLRAVVFNKGTSEAKPRAADEVLVLFVDATGGELIPIGPPQTLSSLAPGTSTVIQIAYDTMGKVGERLIQVILDPDNVLLESDKSDNKAKGGAGPIGVPQTISSIAPEGSGVIQIPYNPFGRPSTLRLPSQAVSQARERQIQVVVDPNNTIPEIDEMDNLATTGVTIASPPVPNLFVPADNISVAPSQPRVGQDVTLSAVVLNDGDAEASDISVMFVDVTDNGFVPIGSLQTISNLEPGGSKAVQVRYETRDRGPSNETDDAVGDSVSTSERQIRVLVDPNNTIPEARERVIMRQ